MTDASYPCPKCHTPAAQSRSRHFHYCQACDYLFPLDMPADQWDAEIEALLHDDPAEAEQPEAEPPIQIDLDDYTAALFDALTTHLNNITKYLDGQYPYGEQHLRDSNDRMHNHALRAAQRWQEITLKRTLGEVEDIRGKHKRGERW